MFRRSLLIINHGFLGFWFYPFYHRLFRLKLFPRFAHEVDEVFIGIIYKFVEVFHLFLHKVGKVIFIFLSHPHKREKKPYNKTYCLLHDRIYFNNKKEVDTCNLSHKTQPLSIYSDYSISSTGSPINSSTC